MGLIIVYKSLLHYIENMGGSSCTCNARVCNYNKKGGYGFDNESALISTVTQKTALTDIILKFVDTKDTPLDYFKTTLDSGGNSKSSAAFAALRNNIAAASQTEGLEANVFCIDENEKPYTDEPETFTPSECKSSRVYSIIFCVLIGIILLIFIGYLVYRYINCPYRKRREKELRETDKSLEYTT